MEGKSNYFKCVQAPLLEGLSVRPSVGPSVMPFQKRGASTHLLRAGLVSEEEAISLKRFHLIFLCFPSNQAILSVSRRRQRS